jgi:signal transduction histidine kinase
MLNGAEGLETSALNLDNDIISEVLETRSFLISGEESALTSRQLAHEEVERDLAAIPRLAAGGAGKPINSLPAIIDLHRQYDEVAEELIRLRQNGQDASMLQTFFAKSDPLVAAVQAASRDLQMEVQDRLMDASAENSRNTERIVIVVIVFFLACTALGGVLLIQSVSPALNTLDYVENALVSAAASRVYHPIAISDGPASASRMINAYNELSRRLANSTNTYLKYVSYLHHEINSLLASVVGYGYMLSDETLRPEDADPAEYGRVIVQQTRRTTQLVEDFTLAARIEGNQFAPALMPVRLGPLLKMLVEELQEECDNAGSHHMINLRGADQAIVVLGDALSLESAFRKVVDNAIKYSPDGTQVDISLEICSHPASVRIQIRDQGVGIASEDLPGLFQPFFRIKNDATRRVPGNGMGLFLASAIVQVHHGHLSVQSQVGKGSVFTITMPLEK